MIRLVKGIRKGSHQWATYAVAFPLGMAHLERDGGKMVIVPHGPQARALLLDLRRRYGIRPMRIR